METVIEISYKEGVFDATGEGVRKDIRDLGIKGVKKVFSSQLYLIEGGLSAGKIRLIAERILCDPVNQHYTIVKRNAPRRRESVEVWFKKGVTDNVGASVKKAIEDLKTEGVSEVRSGKKYRIEGKLKKEHLIDITTKLLANSVVEEYRIYGG